MRYVLLQIVFIDPIDLIKDDSGKPYAYYVCVEANRDHPRFFPPLAVGNMTSCLEELEVPNPFVADTLEGLYDPEGLKISSIILNVTDVARVWQHCARDVLLFNRNCEDKMAFKRLLEDGLVTNRLGMDFRKVHEARYPDSEDGADLNYDTDMLRLRRAYFSTRIHNFYFGVDVPTWFRPVPKFVEGLSERHQQLIHTFRRQGYVQVDSWDGLDITGLKLEMRDLALDGKILGDGRLQKDSQHILKMLETNDLVRNLALGYFGEDVRYDGQRYLTVQSSVNDTSYTNAPWHHDGCGNRLKVFIYLHDVDEKTHPTLIVEGTHRMQWYATTNFFAGSKMGYNKIDENLVAEIYPGKVRKMLGKEGGGFIFDTNALHRADILGLHKKRETVLLDLAAEKHMEQLPRWQLREPIDRCISGIPAHLCPMPKPGKKLFFQLPSAAKII